MELRVEGTAAAAPCARGTRLPESSSLLGPVDPSFRALSGRLQFTVEFNKHSLLPDARNIGFILNNLYPKLGDSNQIKPKVNELT